MKNMLMAYFNTVEQKRPDVVVILGHILNFTDEEIKKVWLQDIFTGHKFVC